MNISKYKISAQTFKVLTYGFNNTKSSKVNKVPLLLKQHQMQKSTQGEFWLSAPLKIENPSKYWIQSIIHENVCVDDLLDWNSESDGKLWPDLIKVKDSAPTAVICTLAVKIAKHREGGGEFCKTRHTGKILISYSSTLLAESVHHAGPGNFKFTIYRVLCVHFLYDARDRWFIKTNFAP